MLTRVDPKEANLRTVHIETKADTFSFSSQPGDTILSAGLAAGFSLPYECATGTCGTCHARVMEGEVDPGWVDAPAYGKLRLDKGDVLMCQAHAAGNCSLRVRSNTVQPRPQAALQLRRTGRIDVLRRLTRDVMHFEVALSQPMDFDAGQFVTLEHADVVGPRAYSMVNYGRGVDRLSFAIKRKPDGGFSRFIFERDVLDAELEILGPLGRATFRPREDRDLICIAGGSGIAGMMAMLRHATELRYFESHRAHVFFGVRMLSDAFYLEDFAEHLAAANGGLDVTIAVSDEMEVPSFHPGFERIRLATGMVHEVAAASMTGQWSNAIGFVAGPQAMVDAAIKVLITKAGLGADRIRFDKFS